MLRTAEEIRVKCACVDGPQSEAGRVDAGADREHAHDARGGAGSGHLKPRSSGSPPTCDRLRRPNNNQI